MTPKERHFEFMKAAMNAIIISPGMYSSVTDDLSAASRAREMADAALAEFNKRWPEEEKSGGQCFHQGGWKCTTCDEYLT